MFSLFLVYSISVLADLVFPPYVNVLVFSVSLHLFIGILKSFVYFISLFFSAIIRSQFISSSFCFSAFLLFIQLLVLVYCVYFTFPSYFHFLSNTFLILFTYPNQHFSCFAIYGFVYSCFSFSLLI